MLEGLCYSYPAIIAELNRMSQCIYHKKNCSELEPAGDDVIEFLSKQDADKSGGISCKHCNPL